MSDTDTSVNTSEPSGDFDEATAAAEWQAATDRVKGKGLAAADDKPAESKPDPETDETEKPAETADDDETEVTPAGDDQPAETGESTDDDVDIWANADDAQRAAFKELESKYKTLEHKQKSDDGRVSALQKKLNELEQELKKRPAAPAEESDAWKKFEEDAPEDAAAIQKMLGERDQNMQSQLTTTIFNTVMDSMRPDWRTYSSNQPFMDWLGKQPEAIQSKFHSTAPQDAISLLSMWDDHKSAAKAKADKIKAERAKKLKETETVRGNGTGKDAAELGDDLDTMWQQASTKVREQMGLNNFRRR